MKNDDVKTGGEYASKIKDFYGLHIQDLPPITCVDGSPLELGKVGMLFTAHEKIVTKKGTQMFVEAYNHPGVCEAAKDILKTVDQESLQHALLSIAARHVGTSYQHSRKNYLLYPICRYADEDTMEKLCEMAPGWMSKRQKEDTYAFRTFCAAVAYSTTRAALRFADKHDSLGHYASVRGVDEDTILDQEISDVGLDDQARKYYNLGNQTIVVRMQPDFSFQMQDETGKAIKSIPKRGADPALYEAAKADFAKVKKDVRNICRGRSKRLFQDFLSGRRRPSSAWQGSYLHNAILRQIASQLVWAQGDATFILTGDGPVDSVGGAYSFTDEPILVAHPMEMRAEEVTRWQQYLATHGIKQPFTQVWEPVIDPASIQSDRYKGYPIPFYRFMGMEEHGITTCNYTEGGNISLDSCHIDVRCVKRFHNYLITKDDLFEVTSFRFYTYNRRVNHIVAYLDKITVLDRVKKDDVSIVEQLDRFTYAQITDFIKVAQESGAVNVLALLLDYKNAHFSDRDPMDEFTLE